ncbi:hypothetical protein [Altericista sp. CCNU0014]|uniref:hypothetical protein n=1 Tax=Altericista sp. CCNU0014 TaxID=3082949 RepID=UPI00384DAEAC
MNESNTPLAPDTSLNVDRELSKLHDTATLLFYAIAGYDGTDIKPIHGLADSLRGQIMDLIDRRKESDN